ncbi:MAG: M1 family metallopeptidase [Saprospiraceae bacterium]|nr:M1 family metallopeptidase [Saprospiraceae bacterium]
MKIIFTLCILHLFLAAICQKAYFQQALEYHIKVQLNDSEHSLTGEIKIVYKNNSPDVLDKIGFHLWPNAYKNKNTSFSKQKIKQDDLNFFTALDSDRGFIDKLDFKVNNIPCFLQFEKNSEEMAWLNLPSPLLPGNQIEITSPFYIKIPYTFSRLGHVGQSYQLTQWYPKPAVYDHKGWHLMPYLDQGEFYSEFGNYFVEITLAKNYVVAATGILETQNEYLFLEEKINQTKETIQQHNYKFIPEQKSDSAYKTIQYTAKNVHDFAWFADKTFYVQKSDVLLKSGKKIESWTFFNNPELWSESTHYVNRALKFYSDNIGEYPYPQATAVECALNAGGGMEYPMITAIGQAYTKENLDIVITHEVGHNWFYGVLASNERDHPYLDEGINTYYEQRYTSQYYKTFEPAQFPNVFEPITGVLSSNKLDYLVPARAGTDQHPNQNSENFTPYNYGNDVYEKTAKLFKYLETYLGRATFDKCMQSYFEIWKFKHPYPEDLKQIITFVSKTKVDWLFNGFLDSDHKMDYSICNVKTQENEYILKIKNLGNVDAPFMLAGIKDGKEVNHKLISGFTGSHKISFPKGDYEYIAIDPDHASFDLYDYNNYIKTTGLFKKMEAFKIRMLPITDQPRQTDIGITPIIGNNSYNGIMLGVLISGPWIPNSKWIAQLLPFYGLKSKSLAGQSEFGYRWFLAEHKIREFSVGAKLKKYAYNKYKEENLNYHQINPYFKIVFKTIPASKIKTGLDYNLFWIQDEYISFKDSSVNSAFVDKVNRISQKLNFYYSKSSILGNSNFDLSLSYLNQKINKDLNQTLLLTEFTAKKTFRYKIDRYFDTRIYISFYPYNTERNSNSISSRSRPNYYRGSTGLAYQNYLDDQNEDHFYGRSKTTGIWAQQIYIKQGGFKLVTGDAQRTNIGNSNQFIAAFNTSLDLPFKYIGKKIRPYLDVGYFEQSLIENKNKFLFSAGIGLTIIPGVLDIYFPIINSNYINTIYNSNPNHNYWKEISFSLSIKPPTSQEILQIFGLN